MIASGDIFNHDLGWRAGPNTSTHEVTATRCGEVLNHHSVEPRFRTACEWIIDATGANEWFAPPRRDPSSSRRAITIFESACSLLTIEDMRSPRLFVLLASALIAACSSSSEPNGTNDPLGGAPSNGSPSGTTTGDSTGAAGTGGAGTTPPPPGTKTDDGTGPKGEGDKAGDTPPEPEPEPEPNIDPSPSTHPEVVYILMTSFGGYGFCTGTLVSKDVVVTAAHCLQSMFDSWTVVAPHAPGQPRVRAVSKAPYDAQWSQPEHPDVGMLKLASAIPLPRYAELTDISARLDANQTTLGVAVVRSYVEPEAPLKKTDALPITGTADIGYTHGFSVPLFSAGGDSGGGLFLIEKGQMTHKLVGVIREPEPSRGIDHLTRIEPAFIQWVLTNKD